MLYFIFVPLFFLMLLLVFIFINKKDLACRISRRIKFAAPEKNIQKMYLNRFREHKESRMERNIILQLFPFLIVLGLIYFLGNQYIYFGTVLSGSMEPVFKKGDLVLMQTMDKEPQIGDIISSSVYGYNAPITHRVIEINKYGVRTKGDNNKEPDNWALKKDKIVGKAVVAGGKPVIIRGLGGILVNEAGEFTVLTKFTDEFGLRMLFRQFRSMQPLIIFFLVLIYFFILIETRSEEEKRFGRKARNNIKKIPGDKSE